MSGETIVTLFATAVLLYAMWYTNHLDKQKRSN
jgi:hypothetical protein